MTREQLATTLVGQIGSPELNSLMISKGWGTPLKPLEDKLEPLEVEGWPAVALRETLEPMCKSELSGSVILLPLFDAYVMGIGRGEDIEPLLPQAYQRQVYRPQGWISAVVLVYGYMKGVWEYENRRSQKTIKVRMFSSPTASIRRGVEAEVERLGAFLNTRFALEYEGY